MADNALKVIWKFEIPIDKEVSCVDVPSGGKVMSANLFGNIIQIFILVSPHNETETVSFQLFKTGQSIVEQDYRFRRRFIATVDNGTVYHLYRRHVRDQFKMVDSDINQDIIDASENAAKYAASKLPYELTDQVIAAIELGYQIGAQAVRNTEVLESNNMLRSMNAVAARKGTETNWEALEQKISELLEKQHERFNNWPKKQKDA